MLQRKKRKTFIHRLLSIVITAVIVIGILPIVPIAVNAAQTRGIDLSSSEAETYGNGWFWDAGSMKLTLYGVDIEVSGGSAIIVPDGATIELVGYNKLTTKEEENYALYDKGSITITGSGVLECNGIQATTKLSVDSSYIKTSYHINASNIDISDGYIEANGGISAENDLTVTGGYLKATRTNLSAVIANNVTVSAGYVEAYSDVNAISVASDLINSNGVIKAKSQTHVVLMLGVLLHLLGV